MPPPKCGVWAQPGGSAPAAKPQLWHQAQKSFLQMPFKGCHVSHGPYWGAGCWLGPCSASHVPTGSQEASRLRTRGDSNVAVSEKLSVRKDRGAAVSGPSQRWPPQCQAPERVTPVLQRRNAHGGRANLRTHSAAAKPPEARLPGMSPQVSCFQ